MSNIRTLAGRFSCVSTLLLIAFGCDGSDPAIVASGGAAGAAVVTTTIGGAIASGGAMALGGATSAVALGGALATGGAASTVAVGGSIALGGTTATATAKGGATSTGGATATAKGGATSAGGATATAKGGAMSAGGSTATAKGGATSAGGATAKGGSSATAGASSSGTCKFPAAHNGNGSVTWYTLSQGTALVNCSFPTHPSSETVDYVLNSGAYFAAMNTAEYATAAACGACVAVTRDGSKTVTVMIADQCPVGSNPKCKSGHIDLAKPAYLQLGTEAEGYLGTGNGGVAGSISWKYVACPVTGNVKIHLKEPSNSGWNEFLVGNHRTPVAKFEAQIGGNWVTGTRQTYNFFNVGSSLSFPVNVRITDTNGAVITGTVQAGTAVQDIGTQFPTCN